MVQKSEEDMRREKGFDLIEIKIEDVFRRLLDPVMVTEAEMNDICGSFRRLSTKKIGLFPDTLKVLDVLKRNGKKIYMLSNAQYSFTMHEIRNMGIIEYFDAIYSSSKEGMKKPYPGFLQKLIDEEDLDKDETVMIGNDLLSDITIAQRTGIDSIFLNTFAWDEDRVRKTAKENNFTDSIRYVMDGDLSAILEDK